MNQSEKTLVLVLSDPKSGEEALGRVANAFFTAYDLKQRKQHVEILFSGTGTRWPEELEKSAHPLHGLYESLKEQVSGVCGGCADIFGATKQIEAMGITQLRGLKIPDLNSFLEVGKYLGDGFRVITF